MMLEMAVDCAQIIIVDDDPGMGRAIVRLLTAAGWRARMFPSAEAALESATLPAAGCLVLDIELPGMSGLELQSHLEVSGVHLPVVFITGHDLPVFREKARSAGACYLTKPFPSSLLIEAVRRHVMAA
jgi:FixJ family two-component response regulator